jgi:diguanylate cyclase (GGDEF)-like protein
VRPPADARTGRTAPAEELAKEWLVRLIEHTPLGEVQELPVGWIASTAPTLIAEILGGLAEPEASADSAALPGQARAEDLAHLRRSEDASAQVPRDIAALQAVIVAGLGRESPPPAGEFGLAVQRLSRIFGEIQAQVTETLVRERAGQASRDRLTGLPSAAELHEWLRVLAAGQVRYGHPFTIVAIDIEGLKRINDAYGRTAGDRMLLAVADLIRTQIRTADRVFRVGDDEFCVLLPGRHAGEARPLAERLRSIVEDSQIEVRPRIAITVGLASCPEHGDDPQRLLEAAEEATYAAKAAGDGVALAMTAAAPLQDR